MKRNFLYLAVLTFFALLLVLVFAPPDRQLKKSSSDTLLPMEISARINEVTRVEIVSAGNTTVATLVRNNDNWQLEEMGGYQADWSKLQALLSALAQARVVETKTDKPEYYARLGVEDIDAEDAGGVLVRLGIGDHSTAILVGKQARGRQGQYVRLQNAAMSAMVDREIVVATERLDWADSRIVDINASEVAEVEIIHPQGERVFVTRISADQIDFDLVGLPQDREVTSSWAVNSLASGLSMLDMETVRPAGDVDWSVAVRMRSLMFSGVEIMAEMVEDGDEYLVRLDASHPAAAVVRSPIGDSVDAGEREDINKRALDHVETMVEDINRKVDGWAYGIAKYKFDALVKKPEELLKPLDQP